MPFVFGTPPPSHLSQRALGEFDQIGVDAAQYSSASDSRYE